MEFTTFIGIDPSCNDFAACSLLHRQPDGPAQGLGKFSNSTSGFSGLVGAMEGLGHQRGSTLVCIEHIGPYNEALAHHLQQEGWQVWLGVPAKVSRGTGDFDRAKTDTIDAERICRYACRYADKAVIFKPGPQWLVDLGELAGLRRQLIKERVRLLNQIHANSFKVACNETVGKVQQERLSQLSRDIREIEQEIERIVKANSDAARVNKILRSIPGIGPVIATNLMIETSAMTNVSSYRQLSIICCSAVMPRQSGTSLRGRPRVSKVGNRKLKALLYMGAMRTTQKGELFYEYYCLKINQGKHHRSVINDIINKMLKLAFDLCKKCEFFDAQMYRRGKKSWVEHLAVS